MKSQRDETLHTYSVSLRVRKRRKKVTSAPLKVPWVLLFWVWGGRESWDKTGVFPVLNWLNPTLFFLSPTLNSSSSTEESNDYISVSRSNCWRLRVLAVFCWSVLTSTWKSADVAFNRGSTSPFMSFPLCQVWFMSAPVCAAHGAPPVCAAHGPPPVWFTWRVFYLPRSDLFVCTKQAQAGAMKQGHHLQDNLADVWTSKGWIIRWFFFFFLNMCQSARFSCYVWEVVFQKRQSILPKFEILSIKHSGLV